MFHRQRMDSKLPLPSSSRSLFIDLVQSLLHVVNRVVFCIRPCFGNGIFAVALEPYRCLMASVAKPAFRTVFDILLLGVVDQNTSFTISQHPHHTLATMLYDIYFSCRSPYVRCPEQAGRLRSFELAAQSPTLVGCIFRAPSRSSFALSSFAID
jgi:hypothetical protein